MLEAAAGSAGGGATEPFVPSTRMPWLHDLHLIVTTRPATFFSKISSEMVNVLWQAVHVIGNDILQ